MQTLDEGIFLLEKACDKMLASKFVLIDKRISEILSVIASNSALYNLLIEYVIPFNYEHEFKLASSAEGCFFMPKEPEKIAPFVFLLLSNIDDKNVDILRLLEKNFSQEGKDAYSEFLSTIIVSFKNACKALASGNNKVEAISQQKNLLSRDIAQRISFLLKNFQKEELDSKRLSNELINNATIILNSLLENLQKNDARTVYALYLGFKTLMGKKFSKQLNETDELFDLIK